MRFQTLSYNRQMLMSPRHSVLCLLGIQHAFSGFVIQQTGIDLTIGQCLVSDRNLACAILITLLHALFSLDTRDCLTVESKSVCSLSSCTFCPAVIQQYLIVDQGLQTSLMCYCFPQCSRLVLVHMCLSPALQCTSLLASVGYNAGSVSKSLHSNSSLFHSLAVMGDGS